MKRNGFTVVELIVSFTLALVISLFLFQLVINLRKVYVNSNIKTEILNKQSIVSNMLNNNFKKKIVLLDDCGTNCIKFTYNDNSSENLIIDYENNTIQLGTNKTTFPKDTYIKYAKVDIYKTATIDNRKENSILTINIPIYNDKIENENLGLRVIYQFNDQIHNLSSVDFD